MIDGNVLAALITLVALGMFAIWREVRQVKESMSRVTWQVGMLWGASPFSPENIRLQAYVPKKPQET